MGAERHCYEALASLDLNQTALLEEVVASRLIWSYSTVSLNFKNKQHVLS